MNAVAHIEPEATLHRAPAEPMIWHDLANLFPLLEGEAFWSLVEDIKANGVREPIVMFEGKVLDGRNRYLAAREAGVSYPVTEYEGDDPLAFVVSLNLKRRHLNESQRAMAAARIAKLPRGANQHTAIAAPSQADAAGMLNVSADSVQRARIVQRDATPALVASVEAGEVSVSAAAEVARLPEALQAEIVEEGPAAVREAAAEVRTGADAAHVRAVVIEGARAGLRPERKPQAKNPDYKPNPAYDAMASLTGACRSINELSATPGLDVVVSGFLDPAMLARNVPDIRACRDNLNSLLERCDAEQAAA